ncbi:MOSC domain-containing protein [Evansella halocellulosilytica]|uniref:MOSC domain-containing protein n=1 Tax=Evansella halocellulosilytica TaxID=2011013 RepID=UPI000BB986ED|nr:MOSC domain-containing protein [Evansella halocellulosilytica]
MVIGTIKEIVRHPVKSFYGERVQKTKVMDYGLYGDRSHAFLDGLRDGNYLTITQFPEMARYKATFAGEESIEHFPKINVTTPEGNTLEWGSEKLKEEIEAKSKREVAYTSYSPSHVPLGAIELDHILLVTDASLNNLSEKWGKEALNERRFRPNLVIELTDKMPFIEEKWIGKRLKIGSEVEIEINSHCKRCMIITVNPEDGANDSTLLKTVANERNNNFGVYASVIKTGKISVGDKCQALPDICRMEDGRG